MRDLSLHLMDIIQNSIAAKSSSICITFKADKNKDMLIMSVADNGVGMDEKTIKHAFDPFFSNLKAGRRRGMGLAKALRWVESSGGSIRLESRVDHGTRVLLLLPAAPNETATIVVPQRKAAT